MNPSLLTLELCTVFIASTMYGVYLVTLGMAVRTLLITESRWRRRSEINWITVSVSAALFINATLDLALAMHTVVHAFVLYTGPGGPEYIFLNASSWENYLKSLDQTSSVGLQSLTGDAILIYRCWLVYSRSRRIIAFPVLLWLVNGVCHARMIYLQTTLPSALVTAGELWPWGVAFWALTICINMSTTPLIVWRIWSIDKENERLRIPLSSSSDVTPSPLASAMRRIIESGLLYTTAAFLTFVAYTTKSHLAYPASAIEMHSVGIAFNLIIIRRSKHSRKDAAPGTLQTSIRFTPPTQTDSIGNLHIEKGEE
ncbi:hypothetical protein B0H10DRAFT_1068024 [Mycena sp. CBHHK59/15]|nr:hypothetical protein B0H10DRAFT_1068024 [Mycena sp. CBHHK59/15]